MKRTKGLNGHASSVAAIGPVKSMIKIAEHFERRAAVVREAIAVFVEMRGPAKARTAAAMFDGAIKADRKRKAGRGRVALSRRPGYGVKQAQAERRKRTAAFLDTFDTTTPKPIERKGRGGISAGPLLHHGYLKRKGKRGYVRTAKAFTA